MPAAFHRYLLFAARRIMTISLVSEITLKSSQVKSCVTDKHNTKYNTLISDQPYIHSGGQFSHFWDKMSLARDMGHRGSIPGRSQPFWDGWQAYASLSNASRRIVCKWLTRNSAITDKPHEAFVQCAVVDYCLKHASRLMCYHTKIGR